jgi:surface protein
MNFMFYSAEKFNSDLSTWNVDAVLDCESFAGGGVLTSSNLPKFTNCEP